MVPSAARKFDPKLSESLISRSLIVNRPFPFGARKELFDLLPNESAMPQLDLIVYGPAAIAML
jgi:hypothetical protein